MSNMTGPALCVSIVTYNSERYIGRCLDAVLAQHEASLEIIVVDNASSDGTLHVLEGYDGRIRLIRNARNLGFAAAQNQAIRQSGADWVLTLNPDVLMRSGFIRRLLDAGERDPGAGSVCGKLLSIGPGFQPLATRLIDSTGLYFTPTMRHFDRGWHEPDGPHFSRPEYIFGASAAAALYRRAMIDDVSVDGQFFDPDFFCYREDADIAWRAQLLGWHCIYAPSATAYHVRTFLPGNRSSVSPAMNMHSVKNRFLLRIKNATPALYRRHWLSMTFRDIVVVGGCLFYEPRSLEAFVRLAGCLPRALRWRRAIMGRRRADDGALAAWFNSQPSSRPLDQSSGSTAILPAAALQRL
jgi:GT2 family glycosyltransferase